MKNRFQQLCYGVILISLAACGGMQSKPAEDPLDQATALVYSGMLPEALALLEQAMDAEPHRLDLSNYYRQQISKSKQYERSIDYFTAAVEGKHKNVNEMYYNLGFAYIDKIPSVGPMGAGFLSKRAIRQFQSVLDKEPNNWVATYAIGMNYLHWPDYFKKNEESLVYLEKAVELQTSANKPYYILTYIRLGDAYVKNDRIDQAYAIWHKGLQQFPQHKDLLDRVNTPRDQIQNAIIQLYNPNNSIGEINTDISVLWLDYVPDSLVPLQKNTLNQAGVGGQLSAAADVGEGNIGMFSWFMQNLPSLSDKSQYKNVDMSQLGISGDGANSDLASIVAHGMIMGFISQFEDETPAEARAQADKLTPFDRPFFHEGLGMGYAATASLDDMDELRNLIAELKAIDPNYTRLHLAGAGMWFGLESDNQDKVKDAFARLGTFGEAYAYEGYGFSQTLFHFANNPELVTQGQQLGESAAHNFYHGAGRAMWILSGKDMAAFEQRLQYVPKQYRDDAISGYGMGVAFTKIESPGFIFSYLNMPNNPLPLDVLLTGITMGINIRAIGDTNYVNKIIAEASPQNQCQLNKALTTGKTALATTEKLGSDLHSNWRKQIHQAIKAEPITVWKVCL